MRLLRRSLALCLGLGVLTAGASLAAPAPGVMTLSSSAFDDGGPLPRNFTAYGRSISPPLSWTPGPAGVRSYALIVEDPDSRFPRPGVHWLVYNIPASAMSLGRATPGEGEPKRLGGLRQGLNSHGGVGWAGPHPDPGEPEHHYHFTLYALDRRLDLAPRAERGDLLAALKGHVLAKAELTATFQAPPRKENGEE